MRSKLGVVTGGLACALAAAAAVVGCGGSHSGGGSSTNTGTNTTGTNGTNTGGTSSSSTGPGDPHVQHALDQINASRKTQSLPALSLDAGMSSCAVRHAQDCAGCAGYQLSKFSSCAHGDFKAGDTCGGNSENQGVASGVDEDTGFTEIHQAMMAEGPPPAGQDNHYANIMNPSATAVGIGLYVDQNGTLWLSEEFR